MGKAEIRLLAFWGYTTDASEESAVLHPSMQVLVDSLARIPDKLNANRIVRHRPSLIGDVRTYHLDVTSPPDAVVDARLRSVQPECRQGDG